MKNFIFFKINNYIVSYAIYIWYNIFFKFIQYKLVIKSRHNSLLNNFIRH
ncbi:MAG: hypothetical protein PETM_01545 [Petrimonas sp.]